MFKKLFLPIFSLFFVTSMDLYSMNVKDLIQENAIEVSEQEVMDYIKEQDVLELVNYLKEKDISELIGHISNENINVFAIKNFVRTNSIDINGLTSKKLTPLAVVANQVFGNRGCELTLYFLSKGADINRRSGTDQKLPIEIALKAGNVQVARCLINSGAYIDKQILSIKDNEGYTLLHYAIEALDSLEFITHLIAKGADIQMPYPNGISILEQVAVFTRDYLDAGEEDLLSLFLEYGVNPNKVDAKGMTALHNLSHVKWKYLFENDVSNINLQDINQVRNINTLLMHGALIEARNTKGETPLMYAVRHGRFDIAYALIVHGAHTEWQNDEVGEKIKCMMESELQRLHTLSLVRQQNDDDLTDEEQCQYQVFYSLNWLFNNAELIRKTYRSDALKNEVIQKLVKNRKNIETNLVRREITGMPIQGRKRPYMSVEKQNKREKKRRRIIDQS